MNPRKPLSTGSVQLLVSRTKLIFSTSSSLPPSIPHLCHITFSHTPGSSEASLEDALNRYDCTDQEAEVLLGRIKPHSGTGPDGVTSWMLRSFSEDIAPSVTPRITYHDIRVLSDSQFGFRKGRSTIVSLMVAVHH